MWRPARVLDRIQWWPKMPTRFRQQHSTFSSRRLPKAWWTLSPIRTRASYRCRCIGRLHFFVG
jgi:hypothetical protein